MDAHLRDLKYFLAVAEELSFQRAAERLFVSQSLLSKQMRQLEMGLRTSLFERAWREVRLTPAGAALLPAAREITQRWDQAQRAVADAAVDAHAVLTVGLSTSVGRGLVQRGRRTFESKWPDLQLRFRHVGWADPSVGLTKGEVDIAFVWLPLPDAEQFSVRVVARERRWAALPAGHALSEQEEIAFADLLEEPFIALPDRAGPLRDFWLALEDRGGREPRIGAVVSSAEETLAAVEAGKGVVLLAEGNVELYRRSGIVARPVSGLAPSELAVAWRRNDRRSVVQDFVAGLDELR
ncbi:LysR family transcriptional regulator [Actinacidiphila sp. bgisy167]|uniref:LysR family transcriptional regulator n=1 Tax=Actinacidiphila sp. bgisy167 TaxID=3413797 RepID=UPI003D70E238